METLETSVWAVYTAYNNEFHLVLAESDMTHEGWVKIKTVTIQAELPARDILAPEAARNLKKKKSEIRAAAEEKLAKVDKEIQQLLAIENKA